MLSNSVGMISVFLVAVLSLFFIGLYSKWPIQPLIKRMVITILIGWAVLFIFGAWWGCGAAVLVIFGLLTLDSIGA